MLVVASCAIFAVAQFRNGRHTAETLAHLKQELARRAVALKEIEAQRERRAARVREEESPIGEKRETGQTPVAAASVTHQSWDALKANAARAGAHLKFGLFFHRLGIPDEKAAAIVARIAEYDRANEQVVSDFEAAVPPEMRNAASQPALASLKARMAEVAARYQADLENLLGLEGYGAFQRYEKEQPHWQQVNAVASRLYETDAPLTASQAEKLGEILIAHATDPNGWITRTVSNWDEVFSQAALVLTPPQLEIFQAVRDHDQLWLQMNRLRAKAARGKSAQ